MNIFKKSNVKLLLASILVFFGTILIAKYFYYKSSEILALKPLYKKILELKEIKNYDGTVVYAASGEKLYEFKEKFQISLNLSDVPQELTDTLLHVEDRKFFLHKGVDYFAILRAMVSYITPGGSRQGGSTITQQVVRSLLLNHERSLLRKIREFFLAKKLEQLMSKNEILSIYVNHMYLGSGTYGVGAAAKHYLNKDIRDLNLNEISFIVGLFQSPNRFNPFKNKRAAINRKNLVLKSLYKSDRISESEFLEYLNSSPNFSEEGLQNEKKLAPYFVDYIKEQAQTILKSSINSKGFRIFTTLDYNIQKIAESNLNQVSPKLHTLEKSIPKTLTTQKKNNIESSILITDKEDGKILAMVGGRSYEHSQFNRVTKSLRSPGSAFKPVLYALALEKNSKWSDRLYVDPVRIDTYTPKNMGQGFFRETTLLKSFFASYNTPTIELGEKIGLHSLLHFAKKLGVDTTLKKEAGTILGSSEISFFDLARVYGSFAHNGKRNEIYAISKIEDLDGNVLFEKPKEDSKVAMEEITAKLMIEGFRSVMRYGTASRSFDLNRIAVGKTGTSNQSTDNWFCGFTSKHVILTWVGSDSNSPLPDSATGTTLALPIFDGLVRDLDARFSLEEIPTSEDLVVLKIHPEYGNLDEQNGIEMYFDPNNLPTQRSSALKEIKSVGSFRNLFE